ncbi:uncharacterized protein YlxW (UPF0749 family) [Nocardioides thalensis]|uniref:Uncharacterized protein YlxW (UPF0749 family) n=1 Tax=Nocardioides thalensis TaxID=1914755 RepID=A0A853C298_9ACTN|nr:DUF881 domain-containing protein [Nocardioides thalensis]NYJ01454.1 uncharacterized protein YlxW (UPF0749 family) [Nocardioides thalensis]
MPDEEPTGGKPVRTQVVVAVLLGLLGFAAVTQVRANETDDSYSGLRQQDLIDVLAALAVTRQRAEEEVARLEEVREDLSDDTSRREAALEEAQDQLDDLGVLAGLVPATGPGIRLTITEVDGTLSLASLLDTVQELRASGAEAIQVNGTVRVVAQSSFTEVEGGFLIDGQLVSGPYVIDVIGDPTTLDGAIDFQLGPRDQIEEDGAQADVEKLTSIDINAVREPTQDEYAVPEE